MQLDQIVVYTCITGNFDRLQRQPASPNVRYVCFSDEPALVERGTSKGWRIVSALRPAECSTPHLVNRYHKILCHDDFDDCAASIYIDGNVVLRSDPTAMVAATLDRGMVLGAFRHPDRDSVSAEFDACLDLGKITPHMARQARLYRNDQQRQGFDDLLGLSTNYLLVRRCGDAQLKRVMGDWWHDVLHRCHRDQLALQYNLWRNDQTWLPLDDFVPRQRMLYHARHGHPNVAQRAHDILRRSLGRRVAG